MDALEYILLFVGGIVVGVINTLSGGGSLLSLPLMITMGLPADVANGTNRIGILVGSSAAGAGFISKDIFPQKALSYLFLPCLLGALLGATISVQVDEFILKRGVSIVLILSFFYLLFFKKKKLATTQKQDFFKFISLKHKLLAISIFFVIGIYGGFLQAGVGFIIIATLSGFNYSLKKSNVIKVFLIAGYTLFVLLIFTFNNKIAWIPGIVFAGGNLISGWVTSRLSVYLHDKHIRPVLIIMLVVFAVKLWFVDS